MLYWLQEWGSYCSSMYVGCDTVEAAKVHFYQYHSYHIAGKYGG